jgi:hypothetical protein
MSRDRAIVDFSFGWFIGRVHMFFLVKAFNLRQLKALLSFKHIGVRWIRELCPTRLAIAELSWSGEWKSAMLARLVCASSANLDSILWID